MESFFITQYNSKAPAGYNLTDGGDGCKGYKHTEEHKLRMKEIGILRSSHKALHTKAAQKRQHESCARYWQITTPSQEVIVIKNLKAYCNKNNLDDSNMGQIAKGRRISHKGYKCALIGKTLNS